IRRRAPPPAGARWSRRTPDAPRRLARRPSRSSILLGTCVCTTLVDSTRSVYKTAYGAPAEAPEKRTRERENEAGPTAKGRRSPDSARLEAAMRTHVVPGGVCKGG